MADLFGDSFDHYTTTAMLIEKWGLGSVGTSTATLAVGAYGRNATPGVRIAKAGAGDGAWFQFAVNNLADSLRGIALRGVGADLPFMQWMDNATSQCQVYLRSDGRLEARGPGGVLTNGVGTAIISSSVHKYVEAEAIIDNSSGRIIVHVNGVVDIDTGAGGQDTQATANAYATAIRYGEHSSTSATYNYDLDDAYIFDTTGGYNDDFVGDVRWKLGAVSGAGNSADWTPLASTNASQVDDNPPDDDTSYNSSATPGDEDTLALTDPVTATDTILAVQVVTRARKEDAGARTLRNLVYLSTASTPTEESGDLLPDTAYGFHISRHPLDPDGAAWDATKINAMEIGYKVEA